MDFRILYTRPALTDLHQILAWSWENHPDTTEPFVYTLLNRVDLLRSFPHLDEPVKGFPGVRRILSYASAHLLSNPPGAKDSGNLALLARRTRFAHAVLSALSS